MRFQAGLLKVELTSSSEKDTWQIALSPTGYHQLTVREKKTYSDRTSTSSPRKSNNSGERRNRRPGKFAIPISTLDGSDPTVGVEDQKLLLITQNLVESDQSDSDLDQGYYTQSDSSQKATTREPSIDSQTVSPRDTRKLSPQLGSRNFRRETRSDSDEDVTRGSKKLFENNKDKKGKTRSKILETSLYGKSRPKDSSRRARSTESMTSDDESGGLDSTTKLSRYVEKKPVATSFQDRRKATTTSSSSKPSRLFPGPKKRKHLGSDSEPENRSSRKYTTPDELWASFKKQRGIL